MNALLAKELGAAPVTVKIGNEDCALAYPMHAVILYKQRTGDSLFQVENWKKIDLIEDPERWLNCLWAGLHHQDENGRWTSPFSFEDLESVIDFSNAGQISERMTEALIAGLPKKTEGPPPNVQAPAAEAPADPEVDEPLPLPTCGPSPAATSD